MLLASGHPEAGGLSHHHQTPGLPSQAAAAQPGGIHQQQQQQQQSHLRQAPPQAAAVHAAAQQSQGGTAGLQLQEGPIPDPTADLPYVPGEDGEIPFPQTAEQTLAVRSQFCWQKC